MMCRDGFAFVVHSTPARHPVLQCRLVVPRRSDESSAVKGDGSPAADALGNIDDARVKFDEMRIGVVQASVAGICS